jgi:DNA-binding response OmpR family regulator
MNGLEGSGHEVLHAITAEAIDAYLAENKQRFQVFDLVIFATQLKEVDGFDLYEAFKERVYPLPPLIFIAPEKTIEAAVRASDLGARMLLTSPVLLPEFLELVGGILAGARW